MTRTVSVPERQLKFPSFRWLGAPLIGVALAVIIAAILFSQLFGMSNEAVISMVRPMGIGGLMSTAVGFLFFWLAWLFSPSIRLKFYLVIFLIGALTLFNGWVAADLMFNSLDRVILLDAAILLIFTTIVATAFGMMGFSQTVASLQTLTKSADKLASGQLSVRVPITGHDEVGQLAHSFNGMAKKLEVAAAEREELESLRRDLIAWVSHDLRTPLTSIRAMIEALNDGVVTDPEMTQRYYRTILSDVMGLNTMIDDLFELAQLDAGGLTFEMQPSNLSDLVSDTLESFGALAANRGIQFQGSIGRDVDLITMDHQKIGRVLSNLISNALKYTPEGGTVMVSAEAITDGTLIFVRDSGKGFVEADLNRVFEKFYRGEGARSRLHGSSAGLGLSIARGIIEAHEGRIWAENAPTGGAQVSFLLPNRLGQEN